MPLVARRSLGCRLLLAVLLAGPGARAVAAEPAEVSITVHDYAGVPADQMAGVVGRVTGWFAATGTRLEWVDQTGCDGGPSIALTSCSDTLGLTLIILGARMADVLVPRPDIVGVAPGTAQERGRVAYVFYDRVLASASARAADWMAVVTAHELGHLLLPHGSHTDSGLMRASWPMSEIPEIDLQALAFTTSQAEQIRQRAGAVFPVPAALSVRAGAR